jgi:Na+/H+ antiporter NhaD/arsenite permease-like protein
MKKTYAGLLLIGAILAALVGVAAFIFLFARDFNVYILILSPVILACYQIPAVVLYWLYKRARQPEQGPRDTQEPPEIDEE